MERQEGGFSLLQKEIDIKQLAFLLLRRSWIIVICAAAGFVIALSMTLSSYVMTYTASATLYVFGADPNAANQNLSGVNYASRLIQTYMVVIRSDKVMNAVAAKVGEGYTADRIRSMLSYSIEDDTEVFRITATSTDPKVAARVCNAVAEYAPDEIIRVVSAGYVEIIDYATEPTRPNYFNPVNKALTGAAIGFVLSAGLFVLIYLLDSRIRDENDVKNNYDIPLLATIPDLRSNAKGSGYAKKYGYGRKSYGYAKYASDKKDANVEE